MSSRRLLSALLPALLVVGCTGIPDNVSPVTGFDVRRYLGTWYEIARLDHSFERGLERVTASYSPRGDGGLRVVNRGYDPSEREWDEAEGRAYFIGSTSVGRLKVSFFGPFYGAYNIIELDPQYRYALVCGPDRSYLWLLARDTAPDRAVIEHLVTRASELGFDTDELIYVKHPLEPPRK